MSYRSQKAFFVIAALFAPALGAQEAEKKEGNRPGSSREVDWKEGQVLRVRVPVAQPDRETMTTLSFPEDRIDTAITGWAEGSVTATAKRGLLFLRLAKKAEGHLNVIGGSGTHYLLYLEGLDKPDQGAGDAYVKIRRESPPSPPPVSASPAKGRQRPVGALELIQAMRIGEKPEGAVIVRAKGEVAHRTDRVELRLLYVYKLGSYVGRVYELENLTLSRLPIDASRFKAKDEVLIASGLRENVLGPRDVSRLYAVFWRE